MTDELALVTVSLIDSYYSFQVHALGGQKLGLLLKCQRLIFSYSSRVSCGGGAAEV